MANAAQQRAPAIKQENLKIESFAVMQGMNTQEERSGISPGFWSWLMNMQPIGKHTLRVLMGKAADLYTLTGDTIICGYTGMIGTTFYAFLFTSGGAAYQVNLATGAHVTIGSSGTFWSGSGQFPHAVSWGNNGIVIVSPVDYWAWDGTTLYNHAIAAGVAPTWIYPSGASVTTMPSGITGTALEIYNATVWIVNGRTILAAAPGSGNDFATSDGAVNVIVKDSYIQAGYYAIKQLDGFLYLLAASAVDVISDVSTSGSPPTTTFLRVNVSSIIGTPWRDSVAALPSSIAFANPTGVHEVSGGQVRKVSDAFDGIFAEATYPLAATDPTGYHPSGAIVTLNETICYALTINVPDPDDTSVTFVPTLAIWDGRRWFLATQESSAVVILNQDSNSALSAWASTGKDLFEMFKVASTTLTKKAKSWFSVGDAGITMRKQIKRIYAQFGNTPAGAPLSVFNIDTESTGGSATVEAGQVITWINNSGQTITFVNNSGQTLTFITDTFPLIIGGFANVIALMFGVTIESVQGTLDVIGLYVGYTDYSRYQ